MARPDARGAWPRSRRRPTSRPSSTRTSTWPPRRCATATDLSGPSRTLSPVAAHRYTGGGGRRSGGRIDDGGGDGRDEESGGRASGRLTAHDERGKTVHGEAANAGHRVLAPDDAEVEAYLETALNAPAADRSRPTGPIGDAASPDSVVVLDFGSQFAQLIARRVRELDVYSELIPHDTPWSEIERRRPAAIILSGGPMSVYDDDAPKPDAGGLVAAGSPSSASATAPS